MNSERQDLSEVKQRLLASELTPEDVKFLEELIEIHEQPSEQNEIGGRPIVAHLPFGMDVVK
jgi:hypothetical protein